MNGNVNYWCFLAFTLLYILFSKRFNFCLKFYKYFIKEKKKKNYLRILRQINFSIYDKAQKRTEKQTKKNKD